MSKKDRNRRSKTEPERSNATIWVAVIGGSVSIILAILAFPPFINFLNEKWNPTPTSIPVTLITPYTPNDTSMMEQPIPSPTLAEIPTALFADTPIITPSPTNNAGIMKAQIVFYYGTGKAPLQATFDAHSSFVSYSDGTSVDCTFKNVCTFTWDVRLDGVTIYGPVIDDGDFAYTFKKKGSYTVVVYVCRGQVCNFSSASVTVK